MLRDDQQWSGPWPGRVVDATDPNRLGRIRVRVDQVYGSPTEVEFIKDNELPWAYPCFPSSGFTWVPPVGSWVWVMFCQGSPETAVWLGSWNPALRGPTEFLSSYGVAGPQTALMKTPTGQIFEMRWTPVDPKIQLRTASGQYLLMNDPAAGQLEKIEMASTDGSYMAIEPLAGRFSVVGTKQVDITSTGSYRLATTGNSNVTIGGDLTEDITGKTSLSYAKAFAAVFAVTAALTAMDVLTLGGAGIVLATTGAAIAIGSQAGAKQALVLENFLTTIFNVHTHIAPPLGGPTTIPTPLGFPGMHSTTNTKAD